MSIDAELAGPIALSKAKLPKEVRELIKAVRANVARIDDAMKVGPSSLERGKAIGRAVANIDFAVDSLEHFGIKGWPPAKMQAKPGDGKDAI